MAPRKRKSADQPTLEDVVDEPVRVSKSRKGDLAHPKKEIKPKAASQAAEDDGGDDMFLKRRARKTGVEQPPPTEAKEAKPAAREAGPQSTGSDAGIWCVLPTILTGNLHIIPSPCIPSSPPACRVNRAPVVTLWATHVAQRQGYSREASASMPSA